MGEKMSERPAHETASWLPAKIGQTLTYTKILLLLEDKKENSYRLVQVADIDFMAKEGNELRYIPMSIYVFDKGTKMDDLPKDNKSAMLEWINKNGHLCATILKQDGKYRVIVDTKFKADNISRALINLNTVFWWSTFASN